jgi:hypothetical protein
VTILALRWSWRYGHLEVDEHDSLDEALSAAYGADERGSVALECIEAWEDEAYQYLSADAALRLARERYDIAVGASPPRPVVAIVRIKAPNGDWAEELFSDMKEAEDYVAELRLLLPPHRFTLRAL